MVEERVRERERENGGSDEYSV